jgi:hypothetical protein
LLCFRCEAQRFGDDAAQPEEGWYIFLDAKILGEPLRQVNAGGNSLSAAISDKEAS